MAKKEVEKETEDFGQKIPPEPEPTPEPEPEPQTPTPDELLAQAQKQIDELTKERDEKAKGLQTAHSKLTEADKREKRQADVSTRLDGFEETQKILAAMLNEKLTSGDMEPSERKDYLSQFDEITKRQKADREQAQTRSQQEEHNRQCDAIYARAEGAFKDDEDALFQVRTFLMNGATDLAEKKIAKAEKATDTKEKNVESEEDKETKIREDERKKVLEEHGLWKTETGRSSGATRSEQAIREAYRANPNDPKAYKDFQELYNRKGGRL